VGAARRWHLRRPQRIAHVLPAPDPRREWRDPVLRPPDTGRFGVCGAPLPDREPLSESIGDPVGRTIRATECGTATDTGADSDSHAESETDAHPAAPSDGYAHAACPIWPPARRFSGSSVTEADPDRPVSDERRVVVEVHCLFVRRSSRTILGPLDWTVRDGERWVVLGPNGSGKTTLLSIVGLELWPTAGTVDVLGARYGRVDSRQVRRRIGSAGSAVEGSLRADLTPMTLVMTARYAATEPWWHVYTDEDRARARSLLEGFGLGGVADQPFGTLSAGERRRTSVARALMPDPDLLLLDEPAASLDLGARETLIQDLTILSTASRPSAIVLVSHHVEEIPPGFSHGLVLADGAAVAAGPLDEVLCDEVLSRAYNLPITVEQRDGRSWARMTARAHETG
jgi:iron complex transport system ATP-binding protein